MILEGLASLCTESMGLVKFIGYLLMVFKIVIPIVIIVLGAIDFGKAVVAEKDDEIKKSAKTLLFRAISGVCIFFIPNLVVWIFGLVSDFGEATAKSDFETCRKCIISPYDKDCKEK